MNLHLEKKLLIKNGKIIDPEGKIEGIHDILIENKTIKAIDKNIQLNENVEIIDAKNLSVSPGLIDMHVHSRDPGDTHKEDLFTCMEAATAGGFTSICVMPNTNPVMDNLYVVGYILEKAKTKSGPHVYPIGAITKNQDGILLSPYKELKDAGVIAISDDGKSIRNPVIFKNAMMCSKSQNLAILSHSEVHELSENGCMNEGFVATNLGLRGIPNIAESICVSRDIELANYADVPIHICHVSTKESVDIIRKSKEKGKKVTCETAPHYFSLTEEAVNDYNTNAKVNPPLRNEKDRIAIIEGLLDGTIDVIASDHAPHHYDEKMLPFEIAKNGIIGLETSFSISYTFLVKKGILNISQLIKKMSYNPAKILKLNCGKIKCGEIADLTIFDENEAYPIDVNNFKSKSKNCPFNGMKVFGKIKYTICEGKIISDILKKEKNEKK